MRRTETTYGATVERATDAGAPDWVADEARFHAFAGSYGGREQPRFFADRFADALASVEHSLGVTATRSEVTDFQRDALVSEAARSQVTAVRHGDCVGGDETAHEVAGHLNKFIVVHPPANPSRRAFRSDGDRTLVLPARRYLDRNKVIVVRSMWMVALPATEEPVSGSGTWWTAHYAWNAGVPLTVYTPTRQVESTEMRQWWGGRGMWANTRLSPSTGDLRELFAPQESR